MYKDNRTLSDPIKMKDIRLGLSEVKTNPVKRNVVTNHMCCEKCKCVPHMKKKTLWNSLFSDLITRLCCSMHFYVFFVLFHSLPPFCVLFVCNCVLYYCHRVATQLQLTNISYHINKFPTFLLQLPVICHLFHLYFSPKREKTIKETNMTSWN
jgi:type III secretory pathway component EscT